MRKLLLSLVCMLVLAGVAVAVEAVFVKYDGEKKELTVKEGDKESVYKITDKTKVVVVDKDGNAKEADQKVMSKVLEKGKAGKTKFDITADKDTLTEIKLKSKK